MDGDDDGAAGCGNGFVALTTLFLDDHFNLNMSLERQEDMCDFFEHVACLLAVGVERGLLRPRGSMTVH
jgi:hypothetical protein